VKAGSAGIVRKAINMKGIIYCVLSCICVSSFAMSQDIVRFSFDANKGCEVGAGDFIQLKDGTVIKGDIQTFKLGLGILNKAGSVTLNNKEYDANDIAVFQADSNYYTKVSGIKHFMQRKKAGKINLYYQHIRKSGMNSRGSSYIDEYDLHFLQKGAGVEIQKFSIKLLAEMLSDNPKALSFLEEYKKAKRRDRDDGLLDKAIDTYNNG
jgi:hypothetical protein